MKRFLGGIALGVVLGAIFLVEPEPKMEIMNTAELTAETLENRNGDIIVERVLGIVIDAESGLGYELHNGNHISYKNVLGISNGDVVCTYLIYNPDTNIIDDIVDRYDYVIK